MGADNFKKAEMIELHDAGVVVPVKGYSDAIVGWTEYSDQAAGGYILDGDVVADLAKIFNVKFGDLTEYSENKQFPYNRKLKDLEFEIKKSVTDISSNMNIKELWAKIEGPKLLHIRIHIDDPQETIIQQLTYSGNFTVWWDRT